MKKTFLFLLFTCFSLLGFSQAKFNFGLTAEGSWFSPHQSIGRDFQTKGGFGSGIGVYASRNIWGRLSADAGLGYRYKTMQQHYIISTETGGSGYSNGNGYSQSVGGWDKLPLHHLVVPLHLQLLIGRSFFLRTGVESTWLLNYDVANEKPEFNWTFGFGSQRHKLKWSVDYIKGFKDQGFVNKNPEPDGHFKGSINRNNMIQLSLSYPIWQEK